MPFPRILLASSSTLVLALLSVAPAHSQEAQRAAGPDTQVVQKSDDERRGDKPGRKDAGKNEAAPQADKQDGDRAGKRQREGGPDRARGRDAGDDGRSREVIKKKQDGEPARRDAERQKQGQEQQAKERDHRRKQDADAARQEAVKKQEAEAAARKDAERQKQMQEQQAKERDLKRKQDADAARQEAVKKQETEAAARKAAERQKQTQDQQARERDPKRKQDADAARKEPRAPRTFDRARADQEFERARKEAQQKGGSGPAEAWRPQAVNKFEELRKGRKTREEGSRNIITEPDKRVIIRDEKRTFIRHDETARFAGKGRQVRRERQKDGTWLVVTAGLAGALIYSLQDDDGRVMRRSRKDKDGREHVLFDDRHSRHGGGHGHGHGYGSVYIDLPAPVISIPRDRYIVDYDRASPDDLYDALNAPPVERLQRHYSLNEVRQNYSVLERMRRVDLDAINFVFASWDVGEDQYPKLERIARAMHRVLDRSPNELFLIEGHTDAVGNEIDNLSLSDRRAEMVATILTDVFDIPPENLVTQGYGEGYLKELTEAPSRINRRVAVRRITPLLARDGWDD